MEARRPSNQAFDARKADPRLKRAEPPARHLRSLAAHAAAGFLVVLPALLALPLQAEAQTTLVSNTGQTSDGTLGDSRDRAQAFTTGANSGGYTLSSVEIISADAESDDAAVSVCTVDVNGFATSTCTALTAPSSFAAGTLEFTGNMTLAANTTYTLLLTNPGGETVALGITNSNGEDTGGATGWSIDNAYDIKDTSGVWGTTTSGRSFLIAVKGTVVGTTLSTEATLRNLALEGATGSEPVALSPVFDSDTETYTSAVANRIDAVTLTATKTDANATVAITNDGDTSTPGTAELNLTVGSNTMTVTVTAESGATKTYTITVTRASAPPAPTECPTDADWCTTMASGTRTFRRPRSTLNFGDIGAPPVTAISTRRRLPITEKPTPFQRLSRQESPCCPETRSLPTN